MSDKRHEAATHLPEGVRVKKLLATMLFACAVAVLTQVRYSQAAQRHVVAIPNAALGRALKALVVLPDAYQGTDQRFRVVYFLHGYGDSYMALARVDSLDYYADKLKLILVGPDGNRNSWYLDSPVREESQFETFVVDEVIPFVDSCFRTVSSSKGRAIIGTSMGGHGALTLLARHPDTFRAGGSISGILDLSAFPGNWEIQRVLGPYRKNHAAWRRYSFVSMAERLNGMDRAIIIDCGRSDFALETNRAAHRVLTDLEILHEYHERAGEHAFAYVEKVIGYHLAFLASAMEAPAGE